MSDRIRQALAFVIAMGMVIAVAAGPSLAQEEPATSAIEPAALNADTVDGRHAVGSGASKAKRARKLVATNASGFLPSNIVKPYWSKIKGKPAVLADDKIGWFEIPNRPKLLDDMKVGWGEVANKPAGFADGVDDVGYASATRATVYDVPATSSVAVFADTPIGTDIELTIIPAVGRRLEILGESVEQPTAGTLRRYVVVRNNVGTAATFKVRTRVYNEGIAPAALSKVAKQIEVHVTKVPKKLRQ